MKSVKQKREQLMKQIRSKQRNEKISQNRQKLFASYEDESLVSLIFFMIDKDGQEINADSFDDFLEIISDQMLGASEEENKIHQGITHAILQRYGGLLRSFQQRVKSCDSIKRFSLVHQHRKAFDLIRFLTRLQFIEKPHLNVLDSLLESTDIKLKQLIDRSVQIQCNSYQENNSFQIMDDFIMIFQLRLKVQKQLSYLYFLSTEMKYQGTKKSRLGEQQREMIISMTEKWIGKYILLDFVYFPSFLHFIRESFRHWQKLEGLIKKHEHIHLEFLIQHNEVLQKIIISQDIIKSHKKITEVLLMFFSLSKKKQNAEIELTQNHNDSLDEQLILFMDLGIKLIKSVQSRINDHGQTKTNQQLLQCLIGSFLSDPFEVLNTYLTTMQQTQRHQFLQSVTLMNKGYQKQPYPLIVRLIHSIQELEYCDLVNFVELLSIIISYNETAIDLLFKTPTFQGYYNQKLNFQTILETKLLRHVSAEVRRRAVWLLSNITASEEFYPYGLGFLKSFYLSNVLEEDSSHKLTKEDALIKESILQAIMNYLSNLRSLSEVEELIGFSMKGYNQSLFIWIIRTLGSVVQNLSSNNAILKNTQKFIEVLVYSLYNLLTLQQNQRQGSEQNPRIVLSIMETYRISRNLETIYHNAETTNQYSRFFSMIETLLDVIEKVKNES